MLFRSKEGFEPLYAKPTFPAKLSVTSGRFTISGSFGLETTFASILAASSIPRFPELPEEELLEEVRQVTARAKNAFDVSQPGTKPSKGIDLHTAVPGRLPVQ